MSGCFSRISFAARSPSSVWVGGILMSTIAMSGLYERTFSSRSSAVPLCPTISNPASSSRLRDALAQQHRVVGKDDADARLFALLLIWVLDVDAGSVADKRDPKRGRRSARLSEQRLDRRRGELGLRNEAERGAAPRRARRNRRRRGSRSGSPAGADVELGKPLGDLEPVEVRQLHVDDRQVGAVRLRLLDAARRRFRLRPRRRSRLARAAVAPQCGRRCCRRR